MIREGKEERGREDRQRDRQQQTERQTDAYKHEMCVHSGDTV